MTTLMVVLCAIRDVLAVDERTAVEEYNELYLINKFEQGAERFRLMPTEEDRNAFFACVQGEASTAGTDADRAVRPNFRWSDPADARDPRQILEGEGIPFDDAGRADSSRRVSAEELAALVGTLEDEILETELDLEVA